MGERITYSKRLEPEQRDTQGNRLVVSDGEPDKVGPRIQGRAVRKDRRCIVGEVRIGQLRKPQRHFRRSDVLFARHETTGDYYAQRFRPDPQLPAGDEISTISLGQIEDQELREKIVRARKRRTTSEHWRVPPREGAVAGTSKIPPVIETGPGKEPGYRMPSKLQTSAHLPPKLQHR